MKNPIREAAAAENTKLTDFKEFVGNRNKPKVNRTPLAAKKIKPSLSVAKDMRTKTVKDYQNKLQGDANKYIALKQIEQRAYQKLYEVYIDTPDGRQRAFDLFIERLIDPEILKVLEADLKPGEGDLAIGIAKGLANAKQKFFLIKDLKPKEE